MLRRLFLLVAACLGAAVLAPSALAVSPNVVVSQVYGGGGNTGATYTHDYIELFNRGTTAVDVNGWSLQYASATGTGNFGASATQITELGPNTIPSGGYLLVQEASTAAVGLPLPPPLVADATPIAMSATAGKVALVNTTTPLGCNGGSTPCSPAALAQIVDLVGYGAANFFEGSAPTPAPSNTTAALRNGGGCTDTDQNASDFTVGTPAPRNFSTDPAPCAVEENDPVVVTCGGPLTPLEGVGATRAVSATDADGTVTAMTIDSVTPAPAAGTVSLTGFAPATTDGGTATATVAVSGDVPPGSYSVVVAASNDDATPQTGSCTLAVSVLDVKTIGEVQGQTLDTENGATDRSPFAPLSGGGNGQTVAVRGVITQKTLARLADGTPQRGFFLQSTPSFKDADPLTSDGIFVFTAQFTDLIGGYVPEVGDEIVISGVVQEDFNLTRIRNASLVAELGPFLDLDVVAPAFDADPPDSLADANRYWERREGMRGRVPAGSVTVDGLDVFPSTLDGEQWLIRAEHPVAQRQDPFGRRVFRDAHPLDNLAGLFDDGNGYRIMLASLGVKATVGDTNALLTPARTFETLQNDIVGGVYFSFAKYSLQVAEQPQYAAGVDPSTNAPPQPFDRFLAYSVADYNVENLYDYRDDPFDGCDFVGNAGCPGVSPPFDYVPASDAVYQARLGEIATQIVDDLHAPDILLAQEAEDQDICTVTADELDCGVPGSQVDNRDGKPDTLQELALRIWDDHGVRYDAAYDRDGSDDRGIVSGFLYQSDRVELLPVAALHPVLGSSPAITYPGAALPYNTQVSNPKALNADLPAGTPGPTDGNDVYTRDPQVGYFRIWRTAIGVGGWTDLYAIAEHFSSTPDSRVAQRREQARYTALIVNALAGAPDGARVVVGGDFNVYPRPDDPILPPAAPSDQLGPLYDVAGMTNLFDTLVSEVPSAAYSYVFQGQTQTLDGQFVTGALLGELVQARAAHVNADFPADTPGDGARGLSDHDPLVARYELVATVAGVKELLAYYLETGQINDPKVVDKLVRHLDSGQLADFIGHVRDKTPKNIAPIASQALIDEAELLLG
jgi:predicted extracellular nuclease